MEESHVIHNTFVIKRSYPKSPAQVFEAFANSDKKKRWYADGKNHEVEEFEHNFRIGGTDRTQYRFGEGTPFPGTKLVSESRYQDIVPGRRIVTSSAMTLGDRRISATLETFELIPTKNGTDLIFTNQAVFFEGADGPEMRQAGWNQLLDKMETELIG